MNIKKIILTTTMAFGITAFLSTNAFAAKSSQSNKKPVETTQESTIELTSEIITETVTETTTALPTDSNGNPLTGKDLKIYNIVNNVPNYSPKPFSPAQRENHTETDNSIVSLKEYLFENGDYYWIKRIEYKNNQEEPYSYSFTIPGDSIEIRYIVPYEKEWVNTSNLENLPNTLLYIDTDKFHMAIGVPAIYKNSFENNTLQMMKELEKPLKIEKLDGEYKITAEFVQNTDVIGEIWALQSENQLVDWTSLTSFNDLLNHDLAVERRWSWDGYYYAIPYNYIPYGENYLYRNPANYTGSSWTKNSANLLMKDMGYIMTETCMENQNSTGFWATGPKSLWLEEDFGIGAGFYDTRFNTDFAVSLLAAYQKYDNKAFLTSAVKYAEYFIDFATKNHYEPEGGGWLVEDYAGTDAYTRTHVSLNHQLAEMNFLYELYNITGVDEYKDTADLMLLGIENTRNKWVMENNNLEYALMYTGSANTMVDYPYLTYNDLYKTRDLLNKYFNKSSDAITYLMACKKQWMDENNITDYYGWLG